MVSEGNTRATFTFTGTSVKWMGSGGPGMGIALVFLDGSLVAQVDTYAPTEELKALIYSADGLQYRSHSLRIQVTGQKNPLSFGNLVLIDALNVAPASPPPTFRSGKRVEEGSPSVGFTSNWAHGDTTTAWSGSTAAASRTAGERATFTFTGTSVDWIGLRAPTAGIARVFVDGIFRGDVDLYESTRLQAFVFGVSGLINTTHTMEIEATGLRNPAATDSLVVVDAFDTRARFEENHPDISYVEAWELHVVPSLEQTGGRVHRSGGREVDVHLHWYIRPLDRIPRTARRNLPRYLNGNFVAEIDTYAAEDTVQGITYEAKDLSHGSHVLTIEATGQKNPLSQYPFTAVDALILTFENA